MGWRRINGPLGHGDFKTDMVKIISPLQDQTQNPWESFISYMTPPVSPVPGRQQSALGQAVGNFMEAKRLQIKPMVRGAIRNIVNQFPSQVQATTPSRPDYKSIFSSPTPTPTMTSASTPTRTPTPTLLSTPTKTPTPTPPSDSLTKTPTPSFRITPTKTPTHIPTKTPTPIRTLTPTQPPSFPIGDANHDGKVNEDDYTIWYDHFNSTTTAGARDGDFDKNGKVDGVDYVLWLLHYGT